jgi:hypothetical protein
MKFTSTLSRQPASSETGVRPAGERKNYESPELVKVASAKKLLQGPTYTQSYRDCGQSGTTRYAC